MPRLRSRKPSRDKEVAGSVKGSAKLKPLEVLHKATAAGWSSPRLPAPPVRKPVLADARYSSTAFDRAATKSNPFKAQVEVPTLMATVGDVAGLTVLDLGCGAGSYSRKLKEAGAKSVHGVDASPELVELAQQDERDAPLGSLTYQVGDVLSYRWVRSPVLPHVDLVLSAHLLSSAHNEAAISSFCRLALAALVPGGRFVSVLSTSGTYDQAAHGASPVKCFAATNESLGYALEWEGDFAEGKEAELTLFSEARASRLSVANYLWSHAAVEHALRGAGFVDIEWTPEDGRRAPVGYVVASKPLEPA